MATFIEAILFLLSVPAVQGSDTANLPHILFVVMDDMGWKDLGYKGAEYKTPVLDSMAADGIDLQSYYVHPMCTPTRASFFSARWAFRTGLQSITTMPSASKQHIDEKHTTLSEVLKSIGYVNHFVGKWHLGYAKWEYTPLGKGFDTFYGMLQGYGDYYKHSTEGGYDFWDMKTDISRDEGIKSVYSDMLFRNRAVQLIDQHRTQNDGSPMFMYLSFQSIHTPLQESPMYPEFENCENSETTDRKKYCNKILAMDQYIGDVKNAMVRNEMWENTLVIISTDNGGLAPYSAATEFGSVMDTHGYSVGNNLPLRGGKSTTFEGGVRAVGMITGAWVPSSAKGSVYRNNEFLIHAVDWMPTILNVIQRKDVIPQDIDGVNAWDAILATVVPESESKSIAPRKTIFSMISFFGIKGSSIIHNGWKLINSRQLYNSYYDPNGYPTHDTDPNTETYLYNIYTDPNEKLNVIDENCEIAQQLQARIFDQVCQQDGLYLQQSLEVWEMGCPNQNELQWYPWMSKEGYDESQDSVVSYISTSGCRILSGIINDEQDGTDFASPEYQNFENEMIKYYYESTEYWHPALTKFQVCNHTRFQVEASYCRDANHVKIEL